MPRQGFTHAIVLTCSLLCMDALAGTAKAQEAAPDELPAERHVLEFIERHPPLRQLFTTEPDLARTIARRLLMLESQDGKDSPRGPSPEAVLDLIELMEEAARER